MLAYVLREVMDKLDRGMSITAVGSCKGVNKLMTCSIRNYKDKIRESIKASAPSSQKLHV